MLLYKIGFLFKLFKFINKYDLNGITKYTATYRFYFNFTLLRTKIKENGHITNTGPAAAPTSVIAQRVLNAFRRYNCIVLGTKDFNVSNIIVMIETTRSRWAHRWLVIITLYICSRVKRHDDRLRRFILFDDTHAANELDDTLWIVNTLIHVRKVGLAGRYVAKSNYCLANNFQILTNYFSQIIILQFVYNANKN